MEEFNGRGRKTVSGNRINGEKFGDFIARLRREKGNDAEGACGKAVSFQQGGEQVGAANAFAFFSYIKIKSKLLT